MIPNKSKLVLGTVQLGMPYGLNNTHGQPSREESFAILDAAYAGGINTFDTAYAYGSAEDVLGEWIKAHGLADIVYVISKMKPHVLNEYQDGTKVAYVIQKEIEKSLKRLHVDRLDGYLFHSPYYVYLEHAIAGLRKVKEAGLVKNIGISTYNEAEAQQAVELGLDYVQVPYNVFDQRLDKTDFFTRAKKNNVCVFARSPFLQGLLLMKPRALPPHLSYAHLPLQQFIDTAQRHHVSPFEAALLFAYQHSRADHIVVGVEMLSQLTEILTIISGSTAAAEKRWVQEIVDHFQNMQQAVVNPSLWSKVKN